MSMELSSETKWFGDAGLVFGVDDKVELITISGDKIIGEISLLTDDTIYIENESLGDIDVDMSKIEKMRHID